MRETEVQIGNSGLTRKVEGDRVLPLASVESPPRLEASAPFRIEVPSFGSYESSMGQVSTRSRPDLYQSVGSLSML